VMSHAWRRSVGRPDAVPAGLAIDYRPVTGLIVRVAWGRAWLPIGGRGGVPHDLIQVSMARLDCGTSPS